LLSRALRTIKKNSVSRHRLRWRTKFDEVGIRNDFSFLIPDVPVISSESAFIAIHC